jgi:hypothetical protein
MKGRRLRPGTTMGVLAAVGLLVAAAGPLAFSDGATTDGATTARTTTSGADTAGTTTAGTTTAGNTTAGATTARAASVPFAAADLHGYATGEIVHLDAGQLRRMGGGHLTDLEEGWSAGTVDTAGLSRAVRDGSDGDLLVQPALSPTVDAYGAGAGVVADLDGTGSAPTTSSGRAMLSGRVTRTAGPVTPAAGAPSGEGAATVPVARLRLPGGLIRTGGLTSRADAVDDASACPLGQPLAYGLGQADDAGRADVDRMPGAARVTDGLTPVVALLDTLLSGFGARLPAPDGRDPVLSDPGTGRTVAETYLSANGDGTFGLTSEEQETVDPVDIDLLGLGRIQVVVGDRPAAGRVTADPTTADPTTADPTTADPTTADPTTADPTTADPTTAERTTAERTTAGDTTATADGTVLTPRPVVLTSRVTGEGHGARTSVSGGDVEVLLTAAGGGTPTELLAPTPLSRLTAHGGLDLKITLATVVDPLLLQARVPASVTAALAPLLGTPLGHLEVAAPVRADGGRADARPTPGTDAGAATEGTAASGDWDLVRADLAPALPTEATLTTVLAALQSQLTTLGLSSLPTLPTVPDAGARPTTLLDTTIGPMATEAALAAPVHCALPVIKKSKPTSVTAGHPFAYTIDVPDPADVPKLACDLDDVSAIDTITDSSGAADFTVTGVGDHGAVIQTSGTTATVTWSGLHHDVAAAGQPPAAPLRLVIDLEVPDTSPAGTVQDLVTTTARLGSCTGGASGTSDLGHASGTTLTGQYSLDAPTVTSVPSSPTTTTATSTSTTTVAGEVSSSSPPSTSGSGAMTSLPRTGGTGGLWRPGLGLVSLGLGAASIALARRSRRTTPVSR